MAVLLASIIVFVVAAVSAETVRLDAKPFLPRRFQDEYESRFALEWFLFSRPVPRSLQRKYVWSTLFAYVGMAGVAVSLALMARYWEAALVGLGALAGTASAITAWNRYRRVGAIRTDGQ